MNRSLRPTAERHGPRLRTVRYKRRAPRASSDAACCCDVHGMAAQDCDASIDRGQGKNSPHQRRPLRPANNNNDKESRRTWGRPEKKCSIHSKSLAPTVSIEADGAASLQLHPESHTVWRARHMISRALRQSVSSRVDQSSLRDLFRCDRYQYIRSNSVDNSRGTVLK